MTKKIVKCCICGKEIEITDQYWGNNPEPVKPNFVDGCMQVCCDDCNKTVVIPARMKGLNNW